MSRNSSESSRKLGLHTGIESSNAHRPEVAIPEAILAESTAAKARIRARIQEVASRVDAWSTSRHVTEAEASPGEPADAETVSCFVPGLHGDSAD